jgi:Skp family chaperone for outer membrane proteins
MRSYLASLLFALLASIAGAQEVADTDVFDVQDAPLQSAILTLDLDRLFAQSLYGQRIAELYNEGRAELAVENRRIADALRDEELALAAQRPEMAPDVFLAEAEAFDAKAQGIRRAQDAKEADLENTLTNGREQFLEITRPVLGQLMIERRAYAVLDRRSVFLSLGSIDITEIALERIDEAIGDGRTFDDPVTPEN